MKKSNCKSIEDVRKEIDRIDNDMIKLIAQRSIYVEQAASLKNTLQDVKDPERVNKVMENIKALAKQHNLESDIAEKVYRTMLNAFIEQEASKVNPLYNQIKQSYY